MQECIAFHCIKVSYNSLVYNVQVVLFLLSFCLMLSVTESGVLKPPIIVDGMENKGDDTIEGK